VILGRRWREGLQWHELEGPGVVERGRGCDDDRRGGTGAKSRWPVFRPESSVRGNAYATPTAAMSATASAARRASCLMVRR
jgi:hypothetical protein